MIYYNFSTSLHSAVFAFLEVRDIFIDADRLKLLDIVVDVILVC